jgi:hypothetical protein
MPDSVRVFVSHHHSRNEDVFTARLVADLRTASAQVWIDDDGVTSDDFVGTISENLAGRNWLVLVMTPAALASPGIQQEVNTALSEHRSELARQATLGAFREYAEAQRATLDAKTPLEKHELLSAMGVRATLRGGATVATERVWVVFDLRGLSGASAYLAEGQIGTHRVMSLEDKPTLPFYNYHVSLNGEEPHDEPHPTATLEDAQDKGFATVDEYDQYLEWQQEQDEAGQGQEVGGTIEAGSESSNQARTAVPLARLPYQAAEERLR